MSDEVAPRVATWLAGCVWPHADRQVVVGDLIEEYALRARSTSPSLARRWYWGQICRSVPFALWSSIRRGSALSTLAVAAAAYVAAGVLEFAGTVVIARLLDATARPFAVVSAVVGLITFVLAGYVAASIRSGAAHALAGIVLFAVAMLMLTSSGSAPLWYVLIFLILGPLAALAGGALRVGWRAGPTSANPDIKHPRV